MVFQHVCQNAADVLKRRLLARVALLESGEVDAILLEIRCQMAEGAVTGHLSISSDMYDLAMELLTTREHARRL
jgi:hypothetical protein